MPFEHYAKKFKKFQREDLFPLYQEHVNYLCRVLKTLIDDEIISIEKLDEAITEQYIPKATCHEVVLNQIGELDLETHQNPRGMEFEYTEHPSAKKVGRDLRVKMIWVMVKTEIDKDPELSSYLPYLDLHNGLEKLYCPFCHSLLAEQVSRIVSYHEDGTPNTVVEWEHNDFCEHVFSSTTDHGWDVFGSVLYDIEQFAEEHDIEESLYDLAEMFGCYLDGIQAGNFTYNVFDKPEAIENIIEFLNEKYRKL